MTDNKSSLVLNTIMIIVHILLGSIGVALYYFLGKDSEPGFYIFVGLFILFKFIWFYYCSRGKKVVEIIANILVMLFFGFIDFLILLYIILVTGNKLDSGKLMFSNLRESLFYICLVIMSIIVMPIIEKNVMKKMKSQNILPFIIVALFECVFSLILISIDTKESVIVSAFVALFILMLTPENLEALFNIKVSKYREQQISIIKFHLILLLPFMYILSKRLPLPNGPKIEITDFLNIIVLRLFFLLIILIISVILIYWKTIRQIVQKFLGLASNQIELNGNWIMVGINKFTKKELIIREFSLDIDGRRMKHNKTIFYFNENFEILNDDEEKIGKINRINSDEIILVFDSCEDNNSKLKNNKIINLIRIGSDKYKNFNRDYENEKVRFHNIKIVDPITQKDIEVTIFLSQNDINYYMETNSLTNDKYTFKNGKFNRLESLESLESLLESDIYESDTFN